MKNTELITLHLVLTYHWYDEMKAGRKDIEYRLVSRHWHRLIWLRREQIFMVRFSRGYTSETMSRAVLRIDRGRCPLDDWNGEYYRLHMPPIMKQEQQKGESWT